MLAAVSTRRLETGAPLAFLGPDLGVTLGGGEQVDTSGCQASDHALGDGGRVLVDLVLRVPAWRRQQESDHRGQLSRCPLDGCLLGHHPSPRRMLAAVSRSRSDTVTLLASSRRN